MEIEKLVRFNIFSVMCFDRNEIHIQAFVDFINGKSMSCHSSSSTFHDFKILRFRDHEFVPPGAEIGCRVGIGTLICDRDYNAQK